MTSRVVCTDAAWAFINELMANHGSLMFHQSGPCGEAGATICSLRDEFKGAATDVYVGDVAGQPFYCGAQHYALWARNQIIVDIAEGRGADFSLEATAGKHFVSRARPFGAEELAQLRPPGRTNTAHVRSTLLNSG